LFEAVVGEAYRMNTVLEIAFAMAAWTVLPLPLAVVVGRTLGGEADLTRPAEFHTLEA
jgi:hypothetical protein